MIPINYTIAFCNLLIGMVLKLGKCWSSMKPFNLLCRGENLPGWVVWMIVTLIITIQTFVIVSAISFISSIFGKKSMVKSRKNVRVLRKRTQRECKSWCQTFKRKVYCVVTVKQMVGGGYKRIFTTASSFFYVFWNGKI